MASRIASTARRAAGLALLDWRYLAIAVKELLLAPGFAMPANKSGKSCVSCRPNGYTQWKYYGCG